MTKLSLAPASLCLLLAWLAGQASARNLLTNGGFEDSLTCWAVDYNSPQGTWGVAISPDYHPDPDKEVCVYKTYKYYTRACQTVDVPSTQLLFTASARLYTLVGTSAGYFAYATVALEYLDAAGTRLGRTMFVRKTPNCTLQTTPTQHLITVTSADWENYEMRVNSEMANLPGINPPDIARVSVVLEAYGNGTSG